MWAVRGSKNNLSIDQSQSMIRPHFNIFRGHFFTFIAALIGLLVREAAPCLGASSSHDRCRDARSHAERGEKMETSLFHLLLATKAYQVHC